MCPVSCRVFVLLLAASLGIHLVEKIIQKLTLLIMSKLEKLSSLWVGKIVSATCANNYNQISGRCLNVRECISDYTEISRGIRYLADIENAGNVRVALAESMFEV